VLLHLVKAAVPIDGAGDFRVDFQRAVAKMDDFRSLLPDIQHLGTAQNAQIAGLTAAFGVEGGGISVTAQPFAVFSQVSTRAVNVVK
jgi:hypothetical protein